MMVFCLFYRFDRFPLMLGRKEEAWNLKRIKIKKLKKFELAKRASGEQLARKRQNVLGVSR